MVSVMPPQTCYTAALNTVSKFWFWPCVCHTQMYMIADWKENILLDIVGKIQIKIPIKTKNCFHYILIIDNISAKTGSIMTLSIMAYL